MHGTILTECAYNGTSRLAETNYLSSPICRQMFNVDSAGGNAYNGHNQTTIARANGPGRNKFRSSAALRARQSATTSLFESGRGSGL